MSDSDKKETPKKKTAADEPAPDRSTADIGLVFTHRGEVKPFLKRIDRQRRYAEGKILVRGGFLSETTRVVLAEADEGFAAHRAATELLISEHKPSWIISIGFSSSLSDEVQPGDIVVANEISDTHVNSLPVKCNIPARKRIHVGKLIVADSHPVTPAEKKALRDRFPGLAADTSSLAVAQVCQEHNVRFLAIRVAVDSIDEEIPEQAASMIFHPTSRALGSALGAMFKGLRKISVMNAWRERTNNAAGHLDRFVTGIVEQIAESIERQRLK
ncbi:MAG TPA: hypothetical protein PLR25_05800 [Planctomycetaceae bacterium]|nr:hypothetical protein [Planctomycetaceae bacterium]